MSAVPTALVVGADAAGRAPLVALLQLTGWAVRETEGTREALGLARRLELDLVVVDLDGPAGEAAALLRRLSLDELPQLFNVLGGSMSLVGPRPPLPGEVARYDTSVSRRLLVKPGLTGLWQISGRSDLPWEEAVRLDLRYVENWSLAMDLLILVKTVRAVVTSSGAY